MVTEPFRPMYIHLYMLHDDGVCGAKEVAAYEEESFTAENE
jgi:hypothetical protein